MAEFQRSEMSLGLFEDFVVFVPGVTQGNENAGSVQDFILLFWCKLGELGSRGRLSSCCNKLLGRAALRVLSSIHHEALPRR